MAVDRQACVPSWWRQLRWLLDFSSKRQKKRRRVQPHCFHSLPLSPYSSFHLPPCGRWLRETQATLTVHPENNQCSRKWAINIKIPSSAPARKKKLSSKAMLTNTWSWATRACVCVCVFAPQKMFIIPLVQVMRTLFFNLSLIFLPTASLSEFFYHFFKSKAHPQSTENFASTKRQPFKMESKKRL